MAERETCLVTGASGGIGSAIALKMAAEGRNVVLHYAGNEAAARAVEEEIHKAYPSVETLLCQGDIKKEEDVERIVAEAVARFSEIEVLVNNAGITHPLSIAPVIGSEKTDFLTQEITEIAAGAKAQKAAKKKNKQEV